MFEVVLGADEPSLVEQIGALERLKCAAAAGQARLTAELDARRRADEAARGIPAAHRGKGLASEIALARHDSPSRGGRHLGFARALVHEMPHTLAALDAGSLSEWRATLIVRESACLDVDDRRTLDAELCADPATLEGKGDKRIAADAKAIAYRLDPHAVVDRAVRADAERTVTTRPAPDNMVYVTALLSLPRGVAVYAALRRAADTTGDSRGRGQVMADTLYERVTGRPAQTAEPIAVNLVITDETLLGDDPTPAHVPGYGPVPAAIACRLVASATEHPDSTATLRRLYRHPTSGALIAMESAARLFPKGLARFVAWRDDTCRTPYCDAPIQHIDHATPHADGGPTTATNGAGLCEACNYTKQAPGWRARSWTTDAGIHVIDFTNPTTPAYRSTAPPVLGTPPSVAALESGLANHLAWRLAA